MLSITCLNGVNLNRISLIFPKFQLVTLKKETQSLFDNTHAPP